MESFDSNEENLILESHKNNASATGNFSLRPDKLSASYNMSTEEKKFLFQLHEAC